MKKIEPIASRKIRVIKRAERQINLQSEDPKIKKEMKFAKEPDKSANGFSLLEIVIAIVIATLIGIAAVSLLNARAVSVNDQTVTQDANTRAEEALSALAAVAPDLPDGGSFSVSTDNTISLLTPCTDQTCDYVLLPDINENQRLSFAKGFTYSAAVPNGSQKYFLRRWRVDDLAGNYKLRRITVAILKDDQSTQPVVLEETMVGVSR